MRSAVVEKQRTKKCLRVADEVFNLFYHRKLNADDGLFTLSVAVARCVQTDCETLIEREAMIESITQIIKRAAIDLDQSIMEKS